MDKNTVNVLKIIFTVIGFLLIIASFLGCLYTVISASSGRITSIILMVSLLSALFYITKGYKKYAANFYKILLTIDAAATLFMFGAVILGSESLEPINVILSGLIVITYGNCLLLGFSQNTGMKKILQSV